MLPEPPLELKFTVWLGSGVHCAYSVWLEALLTTVDVATWVPPLASVNQPSKVYPVRLVVASAPYVESSVTCLLIGTGELPPLASKVTI